jgi:hypothetical protein
MGRLDGWPDTIARGAASVAVVLLVGCSEAPPPRPTGPPPAPARTADTVTGWSAVPPLDERALRTAVATALRARGRLDRHAGQHLRVHIDREQRGGSRYDTFVMLAVTYELVDPSGRTRWTTPITSVAALEVRAVPDAGERARRVLAEAIDKNLGQVAGRLPTRLVAIDGID